MSNRTRKVTYEVHTGAQYGPFIRDTYEEALKEYDKAATTPNPYHPGFWSQAEIVKKVVTMESLKDSRREGHPGRPPRDPE